MLSLLYSDPLPVGAEAPDFTLPDQDGRRVTLSELRGQNIVLVFYPRDETPICRKQLCEFRDRAELVSSKDALVFGVNPGNAASHSGFRASLELPFPLLIDKGAVVAKRYRCKGLLWPVRTVYAIGRDGRIRFAKRGKPAPEEVLGAILD